MDNTLTFKHYILIALGVIGILFFFSTFEIIENGSRGIVVKLGKVNNVLSEGFYLLNPFTTDLIEMDIKVQKYEIQANAASKDLQTVSTNVALNYHLDPEKVSWVYQNLRKDYEERAIKPAIQEAVKSGTAFYTAEELITKRSEVKEAIEKTLSDKLGEFGIMVDNFSIVNFDFSGEFNRAIESKVTAEQEALKAKNDLEKVKFEAQQAIEKSKAEAEASRLQVEALRNGSEVIELRKAEAMLELAKKWNGQLPTNLYTPALPLLNLK